MLLSLAVFVNEAVLECLVSRVMAVSQAWSMINQATNTSFLLLDAYTLE